MELYFCPDYTRRCLDWAESHHCVHVMRHKIGDLIEVFDGKGSSWEAKIEKIENHQVFVSLLREIKEDSPSKKPLLVLIQSVLKNKAMHWLLQKVTEIGVDRIIPVISKRSLSAVEEGQQLKEKKWNEILIAAAKQSHRRKLPELFKISLLADALKEGFPSSLKLVAFLGKEARSLKEVMQCYSSRNVSSVVILIGPEGDFTGEEKNMVLNQGFIPVSLGNQVLRSETAALFLASVMNYELKL
ncbi:RsmE family RNA methyltransferase [Candidatus Methylacidiphilum infernorum]|nr:RsmE family RNA methyltransferase [Candidatus Methylacidiphilum infernorum]